MDVVYSINSCLYKTYKLLPKNCFYEEHMVILQYNNCDIFTMGFGDYIKI